MKDIDIIILEKSETRISTASETRGANRFDSRRVLRSDGCCFGMSAAIGWVLLWMGGAALDGGCCRMGAVGWVLLSDGCCNRTVCWRSGAHGALVVSH
ncbi:unnamed protein product [Arctogadus glacialis]